MELKSNIDEKKIIICEISLLDNPPIPFLVWNEYAIKSKLKKSGFNLIKKIYRKDSIDDKIIYIQKKENK